MIESHINVGEACFEAFGGETINQAEADGEMNETNETNVFGEVPN